MPVEMKNVRNVFDGSGFKKFANMRESTKDESDWYGKNEVWAIPAPKGGSRAFCDRMNSWAQGEGQPGLGYIFFKDGGGMGPIANNIGE